MSYYRQQSEEPINFTFVFLSALALLIIVVLLWLYFAILSPYLHVWQMSKQGEAELAHAEFNRQIATCEAMAKKESSKALADAEVIRAEGVAKANKIIGDSLKDNEGYLRYLWIDAIQGSKSQVIYVPTEAGLPLLEACRLKD